MLNSIKYWVVCFFNILFLSSTNTFSQTSHPLNSLHFYHKLLLQGLYPNEYTFCFVLTSCAQALALQEGKQIQAQLIKHLSLASVYVSTWQGTIWRDRFPSILAETTNFEAWAEQSNKGYPIYFGKPFISSAAFNGVQSFRGGYSTWFKNSHGHLNK